MLVARAPLAPPAAVQAAAPRACGPAAARTLAAGPESRVYARLGSVYGCTAGRPAVRLGSAGLCVASARVGAAAVAGRLAAYAVTRCGVDAGATTVVLLRLSDDARLYTSSALAGGASTGPESYVTVAAIVAGRGGELAWVARSASIIGRGSLVQVVARAGGGARQLDAGPGVVASSLRLRGRVLRWRDGRGARRATLAAIS